jgi:hypothetical protein
MLGEWVEGANLDKTECERDRALQSQAAALFGSCWLHGEYDHGQEDRSGITEPLGGAGYTEATLR